MNNQLYTSGEGLGTATSIRMNDSIPEPTLAGLPATQAAGKAAFFFLYLFTVAVYARPEDIFPVLRSFHLTFICGLCAALAYAAAVLSPHFRFVRSRELRIVLLLTAWYIAGLPFAFWKGGSFQVLTIIWLKTLLIFFLLTQTLLTVGRIRKLLWAIILSELVVTTLSISQIARVTWVGERMHGVNLGILGWNYLGVAAAVTIPYMAVLFTARRSLIRSSLLAGAFFSMMWMLVLTASRGGFITVVFSLVVTWLLVLRGNSRGRIVGAGLTLTMMLSLSAAPKVFWERLGTLWNTPDMTASLDAASAEQSKAEHLTALTQSIEYTIKNPLFGLGLGNFGIANGTHVGQAEAWRSTHNTFTQVSSEAGIPALLLFVYLLFIAVRSMKRIGTSLSPSSEPIEVRGLARATLASLLSFAVGGIFTNLAYDYFLFYPIAIAVGLHDITRTNGAALIVSSDRFLPNSQSNAFNWA